MHNITKSRISNQVLLRCIEELDKGILSHTHWLKQLHRAMICTDEPVNPDDLAHNAHCLCEFGHWYYDTAHPELDNYTRFQTVEDLHRSMHDATRILVQHSKQKKRVSIEEYNSFIDQAISFKAEVRKLQHEIIDTVCVIDHLTGVWNRQSMSFKLNEEYERVLRNDSQCTICMMDLDHFKRVNDNYGHIVGDQVLQSVIERCVSQLRSYDSVFRYGGEEFLISLPETDSDDAHKMIERLRHSIEMEPVTTNEGQSISLTASFGISQFTSVKEVEKAISEADSALLYAKTNGRNQINVWNG